MHKKDIKFLVVLYCGLQLVSGTPYLTKILLSAVMMHADVVKFVFTSPDNARSNQ